MMEPLLVWDSLLQFLSQQTTLQHFLDLLLKSLLIVGLTFSIALLFRSRLSSNLVHLLWLNCLLCISLLPIAALVLSELNRNFLELGSVSVINVVPGLSSATDVVDSRIELIVGLVYSSIAVLFLLRLLVSAWSLRSIVNSASRCRDAMQLRLLGNIRKNLGVSREVSLSYSEDVVSPMSFGLLKPAVILPAKASAWDESTLEDVLIHELSHIKRLDWPTMLFCHLVSSVFWFSPFVWYAKNQLNETAEQSCDAAVLTFGKDGVAYAEDLLRLAREGLGERRAPLLAQLMIEQRGLASRIQRILDGALIGRAGKSFKAALLLSSLLIVSACSGVNLFGANGPEQELRMTKEAPPQYPTQAALAGIAGWALVGFDITEAGEVAVGSARIVDAEPADIFDRSAIRATEKFEFEPRLRNGRAIPVEGVEYLFRYELEDGDNKSGGSREPPEANGKRD